MSGTDVDDGVERIKLTLNTFVPGSNDLITRLNESDRASTARRER